jgi:hypothetical protein
MAAVPLGGCDDPTIAEDVYAGTQLAVAISGPRAGGRSIFSDQETPDAAE